ncbi:MAG: gamma-glutamyltransferase, partial [Myxococcales bacterium]|nr:gamma-glutamyltransferase [Myxococcales bacterium]
MESTPTSARARGIAAAGHVITAEAASEVMAAGGNAIDAVVAALWAASVAEPVLSSPGGGGFILARTADGQTRVHDFFVHTPRRKRMRDVDFYPIVADFGVATQTFHIGLGAAAVPGFVRGVFAAHREHGTMPMRRLVEPAIAAAREGLLLRDYEQYLLSVVGPIYKITPEACALFARPGDDGAPALKGAGDRIANPELADTLEVLAREGDALFYEGEIAASIATLCAEGGGHLTREDLAGYRDVARPPLVHHYRGARLELNPPPALGGLLIAHSLELLARLHPGERDLQRLGRGSPAHALLLARTQQETNRARVAAEALVEGGETPPMLDDVWLDRFVASLADTKVSQRGTTHISVIDRDGNAAAATVSNGEGCGHMIPGTGIMLNNMLGEEDLNPRGMGSWPLGKRMTSMMAPAAIHLPSGDLAIVGSGGSNRIRTAILQVILNMVDFGMDARAAVEAPRLHQEGKHLDFEALVGRETRDALARAFPDHRAWPT